MVKHDCFVLFQALFEEKKNYLFAFEKLVTVAQNYTTESRKVVSFNTVH